MPLTQVEWEQTIDSARNVLAEVRVLIPSYLSTTAYPAGSADNALLAFEMNNDQITAVQTAFEARVNVVIDSLTAALTA